MNLVTAFLWFAIAGSPINGGGYNLSSIGPFETKAACEQAIKDISEKISGADIFLGVPFNIASYALLTHMLAQQCDLEVGEFIWTGGDCHLYSNHLDQAIEQLGRAPYALPELRIKSKPLSIFDYTPGDFALVNYEHHPHITAPVAI